MSFMPTCKEVATATSCDELAEGNLWRRTALRWHLFRCRDCRNYREQIFAIRRAARDLYGGEGDDSEMLHQLEASILDKLEGGPVGDRPPSDVQG